MTQGVTLYHHTSPSQIFFAFPINVLSCWKRWYKFLSCLWCAFYLFDIVDALHFFSNCYHLISNGRYPSIFFSNIFKYIAHFSIPFDYYSHTNLSLSQNMFTNMAHNLFRLCTTIIWLHLTQRVCSMLFSYWTSFGSLSCLFILIPFLDSYFLLKRQRTSTKIVTLFILKIVLLLNGHFIYHYSNWVVNMYGTRFWEKASIFAKKGNVRKEFVFVFVSFSSIVNKLELFVLQL